MKIRGTNLESLFNLVQATLTKHGYDLSNKWSAWPELNDFYPCHLAGNYIVTNEHNDIARFTNEHGNHPIGVGGVVGDSVAAFEELKTLLGLQLADDVDAESAMTYKGHRERYWLITTPEYADSDPAILSGITDSQILERTMAAVMSLFAED